MGVMKCMLCSTALVDNLIPLSHLNVDIGMTQPLFADHKHVTFSDAYSVPSNWKDCLACRECKRALVLNLSQSNCSGYM